MDADQLDKSDPETRTRIAESFNDAIPHNQALGIAVIDATGDRVVTGLAYREDFLGDPIAELWHTSVGTTVADGTCGMAVFLALPGLEAVATLDLRMDYLRPAVAGRDLRVEAECYHVTRCVAFARAVLYQHDRDRPVALCTSSFMRTGRPVIK